MKRVSPVWPYDNWWFPLWHCEGNRKLVATVLGHVDEWPDEQLMEDLVLR